MTPLFQSAMIGGVAIASRVHVAVQHSMMRDLVVELLAVAGEDECRVITTSAIPTSVPEPPLMAGDVVVLDEAAWAQSEWRQAVSSSGASVVVVAAEDDPSSRELALKGQADAWLPRARLGDDLGVQVQRLLHEFVELRGSDATRRFSEDHFA